MREVTRDVDGSTVLVVTVPDDLPLGGSQASVERVEIHGVLDVVPDVDEALGATRRALADDGSVSVRIANVASRTNRVAMLDGTFPPEHLPPVRHFTVRSLRSLLEGSGFDVLEIGTEAGVDGGPGHTAEIGSAFADRIDRTHDGDVIVAVARAGADPQAAPPRPAPAADLGAAQDELLTVLADEVAARTEELDRMRSTRSWRWSRPLRAALARLRG